MVPGRGTDSLCARMDIETIRDRVRADQYVYTHHADVERIADGLTFAQVEEALLSARMLERYEDTGRGESCLIVGFAGPVPIHVVCGWRGDTMNHAAVTRQLTVYAVCLHNVYDASTRPCCRATTAACVRSETSSFCRMALT